MTARRVLLDVLARDADLFEGGELARRPAPHERHVPEVLLRRLGRAGLVRGHSRHPRRDRTGPDLLGEVSW